MKRSSCLSALLVGLSMVTSSLAFAAPPSAGTGATAGSDGSKDAASRPTLVAQAAQAKAPSPTMRSVQQTDPAPAEGGTAPAPAGAPTGAPTDSAAGDSTATPAISIGTVAPGTDAPASAAQEPAKKPAPRPWAGTNIANYNSVSTATIFKGQQQNYNPSVESTLWLLPRYAINDAFQLRGRMIFSYEYTNSDTTVSKNEPRFSDATVQLFYRKIPALPGGIKPNIALNITAPTSPESRARTMIVSPGATLQLAKQFEHVLGGDVMFIGSGTYSHPLYRSTTPEMRTPLSYTPQCVGGGGCQDQLSGTLNPSDTILYALIVVGEWGKWAPGLAYFGTSAWTYSPKEVSNPVDGTPLQSAQANPTSVRQTSYFSLWLDYQINSWLTPELGYTISRSVLGDSGQRGNQFFDRYQDMRVYLGFNVAIDNIMKALEGGPTDAGIVRAKARTPFGAF